MANENERTKLLQILKEAFSLLAVKDRRRLNFLTFVQILTGFLDLIALGFIGLLTTLAMQPSLATTKGSKVHWVLQHLHVDTKALGSQIILLASLAVVLFTVRTIVSVWLSRIVLFALGKWAASESSKLIRLFLSQDLIYMQSRNLQETLYSLTFGVESLSVRFLAVASNILADSVMLIILGIGLFVVDPTVALSAVVIFALIGLGLYKFMHVKANRLGIEFSDLTVAGNSKFLETAALYREIEIRNTKEKFIKELEKIRFNLSRTLAEMAFLPNVSKYLIEAVVVVAALAISGVQFLIHDSLHAMSSLAIFLAAGTRIAPAALRVQQGFLLMLNNTGPSAKTLQVAKELNGLPETHPSGLEITSSAPFSGTVEIKNLELAFPGAKEPTLKDINLTIQQGQFVAIVGPSGSGKTTLVDAILGLKRLTSGSIKISGVTPKDAIKAWPGKISYVPQDVVVKSSSLLDNIELGFDSNLDAQQIHSLLDSVALGHLINEMESGLDSVIGDGGFRLSGGERQRLGVARALFTSPKLIFLDEATSALDAETEEFIANSLRSLKGGTTLVVIAHRLSTVRDADLVIYLANGKIEASGTFDEVRQQSPDFDNQAGLMGL